MVRIRVMVRVSVIYHRDRVIIGVNGRCRLCSCLTTMNGFMRTQIVSNRDAGGYLLRQYQTSRGVTNRRYTTSWDEGWERAPTATSKESFASAAAMLDPYERTTSFRLSHSTRHRLSVPPRSVIGYQIFANSCVRNRP